MKEDRQKQLELRLDKLSEQVSTIIENSKNMEASLKTRLEQVEHEVLDLPENYDDVEDDENLQGKNWFIILVMFYSQNRNVSIMSSVWLKKC